MSVVVQLLWSTVVLTDGLKAVVRIKPVFLNCFQSSLDLPGLCMESRPFNTVLIEAGSGQSLVGFFFFYTFSPHALHIYSWLTGIEMEI